MSESFGFARAHNWNMWKPVCSTKRGVDDTTSGFAKQLYFSFWAFSFQARRRAKRVIAGCRQESASTSQSVRGKGDQRNERRCTPAAASAQSSTSRPEGCRCPRAPCPGAPPTCPTTGWGALSPSSRWRRSSFFAEGTRVQVRNAPSGEMTPVCWPRTRLRTNVFTACWILVASRWRAGIRCWMNSLARLDVDPCLCPRQPRARHATCVGVFFGIRHLPGGARHDSYGTPACAAELSQ